MVVKIKNDAVTRYICEKQNKASSPICLDLDEFSTFFEFLNKEGDVELNGRRFSINYDSTE